MICTKPFPSPWWWFKVATMLVLIASAVVVQLGGLEDRLWQLPYGLGLTLVVAGGGVNILHYMILKRRVCNLAQPRALVCHGGLFPVIRHPMYLGDVILSFGFVLLAGHWLSILLFAGVIAILPPLIAEEEGRLAARFPEQFQRWQQRSATLLPCIW